jgi:hypothetical protein
MTIRKDVQDAFFNYPIKEIRHQYNTIVFVLNGGREIEITSDVDQFDNDIAKLSVELYQVKRERVGGYDV